MADGDATEIVEPSGAVTASELDALRAALASRTAPGLLAAGSLPPGVPADFYSTCAAATLSQGGKFLIDAVAGLEDAVAAAASVGARMVLKVNARELLLAAGDPLAAGAADSVDDAARTASGAALAAKLSSDALAAILWTDGPHPGGALVGDAVYALAGPSLSEFGPVLSPIGAGDTVAGTTFAKWLEDGDPVQAFAYGLACGAASCLTAENAVFDAEVAAAIHARTVVAEDGLAKSKLTVIVSKQAVHLAPELGQEGDVPELVGPHGAPGDRLRRLRQRRLRRMTSPGQQMRSRARPTRRAPRSARRRRAASGGPW